MPDETESAASVASDLTAGEAQQKSDWRTIDSAPRDGTEILGWCVHEADPYHLENGNLTLYGGHTEGLSHVSDGAHVLVYGGGWADGDTDSWMPDWWFRSDSEFEVTANPTHWQPLPPPPNPSARGEL